MNRVSLRGISLGHKTTPSTVPDDTKCASAKLPSSLPLPPKGTKTVIPTFARGGVEEEEGEKGRDERNFGTA